jgi:hypothetical protein
MTAPYTVTEVRDPGLLRLSNDGIYQTEENFAGEPIPPMNMMKHILVWDGTLNGIPIIGPRLDEDGATSNCYNADYTADKLTDKEDNAVSYTMDSLGRVTKISYPDSTETAIAYDGTSDRIETITDANADTFAIS